MARKRGRTARQEARAASAAASERAGAAEPTPATGEKRDERSPIERYYDDTLGRARSSQATVQDLIDYHNQNHG